MQHLTLYAVAASATLSAPTRVQHAPEHGHDPNGGSCLPHMEAPTPGLDKAARRLAQGRTEDRDLHQPEEL